MKRLLYLFFTLFIFSSSPAQYKSNLSAPEWVDSVFKTLNDDEKIAQLMIIRAHSNLGPDHIARVVDDIKRYNVGGLCFFQGGPVRQANLTNYYQSITKTPLLVSIDAEWGLGMRLDSVTNFPYQLTLGAMDDAGLVYNMGVAVGEQCKRIGVNVNYAPVVDINNNPNNPVIGYRSFGEDKNKVTRYGVAYMKGMQDAGIMACAKHFPGHGDVDVDSHLDLPVINKSMEQLDSLELVPFKAMISAGVGSIMIAHLYIPAIDNTANKATSLSKKNVTGLLKDELGFEGLSFTDALEMKGVTKFFPDGTISVEALIAGNDMLCLPASVQESIEAIKKAIRQKKISWKEINEKVRKVLLAKYQLGLYKWDPVNTDNLLNDLNEKTNKIRYETAIRSLTLLRNGSGAIPVIPGNKVAYVGIGCTDLNDFGNRMKDDLGADTYLFSNNDSLKFADSIISGIKRGNYKSVIIGVHDYSLRPSNNYGISSNAVALLRELQPYNAITFVFGNVLALSNFCGTGNLVACYQDDDITQHAAADLLEGKIIPKGTLPVSVCGFKYGDGIVYGEIKPARAGVKKNGPEIIDSIVNDAISQGVFPGCVVLALHKGQILYSGAFGHYEYEPSPMVTTESIYDLASVTKISATTVAVMKLYEEKKINLKKKLSDYLPWVRGTNKAGLEIDDLLLHQAGLVPFIRFYQETLDLHTGKPDKSIYSNVAKKGFTTRVADGLYLRDDWQDTLLNRIAKSPVSHRHMYVYSDNDFILLGKVVEAITGMPLDKYVEKEFYSKLGMTTTGFKPLQRFSPDRIVPTENDNFFRQQLLHGDVHDEGASMFGEVAGHAGLFSDANDLAKLYLMLLNDGKYNGKRYLKPETIRLFTSYQTGISRRGLGFDKPEKDNAKRDDPYPCLSASPLTFGHTGYTGTCVWVDPEYDLIYIFLSNRVYPTRENSKISQLNIRSKIQEELYKMVGIKNKQKGKDLSKK
jgi:beta-N-acetylhexosaminidase